MKVLILFLIFGFLTFMKSTEVQTKSLDFYTLSPIITKLPPNYYKPLSATREHGLGIILSYFDADGTLWIAQYSGADYKDIFYFMFKE